MTQLVHQQTEGTAKKVEFRDLTWTRLGVKKARCKCITPDIEQAGHCHCTVRQFTTLQGLGKLVARALAVTTGSPGTTETAVQTVAL